MGVPQFTLNQYWDVCLRWQNDRRSVFCKLSLHYIHRYEILKWPLLGHELN